MQVPQSAGLKKLLTENTSYVAMYEAVVRRVENYTAGELKEAYPDEYNSWKNRKNWAKNHGVQWSPEMDMFSAFLLVNGPIPENTWTLDRIDPRGVYVPENLRWASKATQSQNRTTARVVKVNGATYTIADIAQRIGKPYDTVRISLDRHGDDYAATLISESVGSDENVAESLWQFPEEYREALEHEYSNRADPTQNRVWFFLKLTKADFERAKCDLSRATDTEEIKELEERVALLRKLHNQTVDLLRGIERQRRLRRIEAHHQKWFGHIKINADEHPDRDEYTTDHLDPDCSG